ncbi:hypothetical protein AAHH80_34115, partial [Burkholderia pseudomallei]
VYREAVSRYFGSHRNQFGAISEAVLQASGALPAWYDQPAPSYGANWTNYRDVSGLIYIYATAAPATDIAADIAKLSENSLLAGIYR